MSVQNRTPGPSKGHFPFSVSAAPRLPFTPYPGMASERRRIRGCFSIPFMKKHRAKACFPRHKRPAAIAESESDFFQRPLPGASPAKFTSSGKRGRAGKRIFFLFFFHNRGQVKNNNKLAFQTFSGTLPA
ncbi:hypothetical protein DFS30_10840 [Akkermansia muciniphila]|nr:hypothetical protein CUC06_10960 [Akkermansia muciniphila]MBE5699140.1 hypothetical protein [Akkermansia sp.]OLA91341.1 MAG: hypothetical protein BHW66_00610 [Akkermansia sp. 54_46]MBD9262329.1 hypothetical protein [Akkermansia muciniphila]PNC44092.1 hypothetical protein CXU08_04475 [Akkermansia muciniphila]